MYRPSWLNFTSDIEEMISEKNERLVGSSSSSKPAIDNSKQDPMRMNKMTLTFRMSVAQSGIPHISEFDVAF